MAAVRTQRSTSMISWKIGDYEQSIITIIKQLIVLYKNSYVSSTKPKVVWIFLDITRDREDHRDPCTVLVFCY